MGMRLQQNRYQKWSHPLRSRLHPQRKRLHPQRKGLDMHHRKRLLNSTAAEKVVAAAEKAVAPAAAEKVVAPEVVECATEKVVEEISDGPQRTSILRTSAPIEPTLPLGVEAQVEDAASCEMFEDVTGEEWSFIERLQQLKQSDTVGSGNDAKTGWVKCEGTAFIKVQAIWKMNKSSMVLCNYEKEIGRFAESRMGLWVPTVDDELQWEVRQKGLTKNGEYWLLHGTRPSNLKSILKTGLNDDVGSQTSFNFGKGTYLADAADKADQHLIPDEGLKHIASIVGDEDRQLQMIGSSEVRGSICIGLVVRAALGKHLELQLAETTMEKSKDNVGGRSDFHWRDPGTKEKKSIKCGDPDHYLRLPPIGGFRDCYDSVKVMCGKYNPEYQKDWSVPLEKGSLVTNAFPFRLNEYLVPFANERDKPRVAVQYLVAYERCRRKSDGTEVGA